MNCGTGATNGTGRTGATSATNGTNRGVKRLIKGSDGRVYYTNSHYKNFIRIR